VLTISKNLNIGHMTVNNIINHLIKLDILTCVGKSQSRGGRKPNIYQFNPDLFISLGMAINEERVLISEIHSDGTIVSSDEYRLNDSDEKISSNKTLINVIVKYYKKFISDFRIKVSKIAIFGIALEGIVDTDNGKFILGTHLGSVVDLHLRDQLEEIFEKHVYIDDPCRSTAFFNNKFDPELSGKNFISIYIGKGVGSGIIINGHVYRGFSGIAGEVGHIIVKDDGVRCKCGNYGCLETIASEESIIGQVKEGIKDGVYTKILNYCNGDINKVNLDSLRKAADQGDKFALNIIDQVGHFLGKALSILVNILNPEYIVICGEGVKLGSYLFNSVTRIINTNALNVTKKKTIIKISNYNKYMDSISIAVEAFDSLFIDSVNIKSNPIDKKLLKILENV